MYDFREVAFSLSVPGFAVLFFHMLSSTRGAQTLPVWVEKAPMSLLLSPKGTPYSFFILAAILGQVK